MCLSCAMCVCVSLYFVFLFPSIRQETYVCFPDSSTIYFQVHVSVWNALCVRACVCVCGMYCVCVWGIVCVCNALCVCARACVCGYAVKYNDDQGSVQQNVPLTQMRKSVDI